MTTKSILLVGVGGQGAILTSKILAAGLISEGFDVKMSEIHGMSQRGGTVATQVKYGEKVFAPNIGLGEADFIVSFEKSEALRALPYLKSGGALVTDDHEIYSMPVASGVAEYPAGIIEELKRLAENVLVVPAGRIASGLGNVKVQNIVLLGALVKAMKLDQADWPALVARYVPPKVKDLNLKAFEAGRA
ncbi:MAG: indolepyruvate oxidoreductase subunit beta [Candidatus Adiutrix sp.]|jgi:indolepyruvate ferredoxin oxidoreductase beta subunit|nr:indolepyruvate oxidoreductase subunit beta [Candidatus Adiutrix sp.]